MIDIKDAAGSLAKHLGRPPWLSSIGIGARDGQPVIRIFLVTEPIKAGVIPSEWEGYPVIKTLFGHFAPLGTS